jgi:hypothetical protein
MKEITTKITEQGSKDALASLSKADKSARYAKMLKAQLVASPRRSSGTLPRRPASRLGSNTRPAPRCTSRAIKSTADGYARVPRTFPHPGSSVRTTT